MTNDAQYVIPSPKERRAARVIWSALAVKSGVAVTVAIAIAGAQNLRLRILATCAGTLQPNFVRPVKARTAYSAGQPSSGAVLANTEAYMDIDASNGEAEVVVSFTPGADGTITFMDAAFGYAY